MLEERVYSVKRRFLAMYKKANAGHIGSSLSCAEILVFLKFAWMKQDDLLQGHTTIVDNACRFGMGLFLKT